jgi:hypothetical protein
MQRLAFLLSALVPVFAACGDDPPAFEPAGSFADTDEATRLELLQLAVAQGAERVVLEMLLADASSGSLLQEVIDGETVTAPACPRREVRDDGAVVYIGDGCVVGDFRPRLPLDPDAAVTFEGRLILENAPLFDGERDPRKPSRVVFEGYQRTSAFEDIALDGTFESGAIAGDGTFDSVSKLTISVAQLGVTLTDVEIDTRTRGERDETGSSFRYLPGSHMRHRDLAFAVAGEVNLRGEPGFLELVAEDTLRFDPFRSSERCTPATLDGAPQAPVCGPEDQNPEEPEWELTGHGLNCFGDELDVTVFVGLIDGEPPTGVTVEIADAATGLTTTQRPALIDANDFDSFWNTKVPTAELPFTCVSENLAAKVTVDGSDECWVTAKVGPYANASCFEFPFAN